MKPRAGLLAAASDRWPRGKRNCCALLRRCPVALRIYWRNVFAYTHTVYAFRPGCLCLLPGGALGRHSARGIDSNFRRFGQSPARRLPAGLGAGRRLAGKVQRHPPASGDAGGAGAVRHRSARLPLRSER
ncbi:protein of unknown function [Sterolibacterium denitrificans]|uniref:Uncharacterized protein n=1 Tax=Sterolibacterium denitrificans TaxID=157592 RepID=A0A7Z7HP81_9PROT|nr:protein of unknown function [Sterolibacterium denitrificans]